MPVKRLLALLLLLTMAGATIQLVTPVHMVIEDLESGMVRSLTKEVTDLDIELFAQVSTDRNPVHLDDAYAMDTIFGGRIAHGMLSAGFISTVIGCQLPGPGTIYVSQTLNFMAPVAIGDTITATAEVTEILTEKKRVRLKTICTNQEGKEVLVGEALVSPPRG